MLSELFWISLGVASEVDGCTKNPHIKFERGAEYIKRLGYNQIRQRYLHDLIYSPDNNKREEFFDILGHNINWSDYDKYNKKDRTWIAYDEAIREIAANEGWKYFDDNELYADPVYRSLIGMEKRPPIISYKPYPEKVLLSPEELERYNIDVSDINRTYVTNTVSSVVLPVLLSIASIVFAWCSKSIVGGSIYFVLSILTMATTYINFYKYRNEKTNGYVQFFVYLLCPFIALSQATNCEPLKSCLPMLICILIALIAHIICVIGYAIYARKTI